MPNDITYGTQNCSLCLDISFFTFCADTEPGKWKPPLNESVLKEGAIELWIHHAPSHFNLTEFDVILLKRSHSRFKAFKRTTYIAPVSLIVRILKSRQISVTHLHFLNSFLKV